MEVCPDQFVLALDQGTTSARAILFDRQGNIHGVAQQEITQHYPQPGWVEHDAGEIWQAQLSVARAVLRDHGVTAAQIAAVGITNQRETTVLWDRASGEPLHRAIVWPDRRTAGICDELTAAGHAGLFRERTGLVVDAYFSGTKLKWLLDHIPGPRPAPSAASWLSAPSTAGWPGSFRAVARTSPIPRMPRAPCFSTFTAAAGMTNCWRCSTSRRRCCRALSTAAADSGLC